MTHGIVDLTWLTQVAALGSTIFNNVQNMTKREYTTIAFFSITLCAVLYTQQYHNNELRLQSELNFQILRNQYNERFELRMLQSKFEEDIREVIKNNPEDLWCDVKPNIDKWGTFIALENFVEEKSFYRGGPRDVFDDVHRNINEPKRSIRQKKAAKHADYQHEFRNHLSKLFQNNIIKPGYKWSEVRILVQEHKCFRALDEFVKKEELNYGRPRDIFKDMMGDLIYYDKIHESTCSLTDSNDDIYQLSNKKMWQLKMTAKEEDIADVTIRLTKLRNTSQYSDMLKR